MSVTTGDARRRLWLTDADYQRINDAALTALPALLSRWLPGGRQCGYEYIVRNPRRVDRNLGSFLINLRSGAWSDFATGDKGGDPVSLAAFLGGLSQSEAAEELARMLRVALGDRTPRGRRHA